MATTIRSHAFIVGHFQHKIDAQALEMAKWVKVVEDEKSYAFLCSYFHKSHVDAMIEAEGQRRPKFLNDVHHYRLDLNANVPLSTYNSATGRLVVLEGYKLNIIGLHVYFMPLDITLYAIEVDDSGSDLNDLTLAHLFLREFSSRWEQFNDELKRALEPIKVLCSNGTSSEIESCGNKLKIFQILMVDEEVWTEGHLYEIGTCSPLDIVGKNHNLTPSDEYYNTIIKNNKIAPFKTWMSLALMDSYTALIKSVGEFNEAAWGAEKTKWVKSYYRFIFLRVVMQEAFISSENVRYRLNHSNANIIRDLARMDQYYFYNNISYNFLPDMLNKQMAGGMSIDEEKAELSTQIKEWDNKNSNTLMGILSVFAIISLVNDVYCVAVGVTSNRLPMFLSFISTLALICILFLIVRLIRRN